MVPMSAPSVCYVVDTRASQFTVQAFASGLAAAVAHSPKIAIRDWTGEARLHSWHFRRCIDQGPAESSFARGSGRTEGQRPARTSPGDEGRKCWRRRGFLRSCLKARRYGRTDRKDDLYRLSVQGQADASRHGRTITAFAAQVALGVDSARAYGEFKVLQTDYADSDRLCRWRDAEAAG